MATDTPEDTSLKRRARRRLIGAIALVLLAVIVLPMIFDAERKPLDQEVTIQIPGQGEYAAPAPKPGTAPATPPAVMPAAPGPDAKGDAPKAEAPKSEPSKAEAPKAEAPKSEPAKAEPPKAEPPKAAAKAEPAKEAAKAPEKAPEKAPAKDAPKKDDGARALALLNGDGAAPKSEKSAEKAAEKPAPEKAAGSFFVQVAAFSSEEKVQEARDKLSSAGVKTYVEKVTTKSGEVTRVRAGPFQSRDAADAVRGKAAGLGYGGAAVVSR